MVMDPGGAGPTLRTERLVLRRWRESDRAPFAALNADPEVMRYYLRPLSAAESDARIDRIEAGFEAEGYGLWALERVWDGAFLGFSGLAAHTFEAPFTPCVEVGWRLARDAWGHGYATEAARAALAFGFDRAGLREIVSFTTPLNLASIRVMSGSACVATPPTTSNTRTSRRGTRFGATCSTGCAVRS